MNNVNLKKRKKNRAARPRHAGILKNLARAHAARVPRLRPRRGADRTSGFLSHFCYFW